MTLMTNGQWRHLFMLVLLVGSLFVIGVQGIDDSITLSSPESVFLGEDITVDLSGSNSINTTNTLFEVQTPETTLRLLGEDGEIGFPTVFTPTIVGEHKFQLIDRALRTVILETSTIVLPLIPAIEESPSPVVNETNTTVETNLTPEINQTNTTEKTNETNQSANATEETNTTPPLQLPATNTSLNTTNITIHLEKQTYHVNEEVIITIGPDVLSPVTIIVGKQHFIFNGEPTPQMTFVPRRRGIYTIEAPTPWGIESVQFNVTPNNRTGNRTNATRINRTGNFSRDHIFKIRNSKQQALQANAWIRERRGDRQINETDLSERRHRIRLVLEDAPIEQIEFDDLVLNGSLELGIDSIEDPTKFQMDDITPLKMYAIDPEKLNFTNATVTGIATGTELWKCKNWNFTTQTCFGSWIKIQDTVPGAAYSFELSPQDPGFAEITRNVSYRQNPDIILKQVRTTDPLTPNQTNTINVTVNVTNGNGTNGFGTWNINVTLWNITRNELNFTSWANATQDPAATVLALDVGDIDGDDDNDIVTIDDTITVYYNNGGAFNTWTVNTTDPAGSNAYRDVLLGDMDGDGDNDIITIESGSGPNDLVRITNNTGGVLDTWTVSDITLSLSADGRALALADFDYDGDMDIASSDFGGEITIWTNNGGSYSSSPQSVSPAASVDALSAGDIDGDGDVDLVSGDANFDVIVWTNNGGTFSTWTSAKQTATAAVTSVRVADTDRNGSTDIGASYASALTLFTNNGGAFNTWTTQNRTTADAVENFQFGDFDNDNDLDITFVFSSGTYTAGVIENNGSVVADWPITGQLFSGMFAANAVDWGDFDSDSDEDIVIGGSGADRVQVFTNADSQSAYINSTSLTFTNASGEEQLAQLNWSPAGTGVKTVIAIADTGGEFMEILETNNMLALDVNVSEAGGPQDANFTFLINGSTTVFGYLSGTLNNTFYNDSTNAIQLDTNQNNGSYTSQVFDAGSNSTWNNISWISGIPYQTEIGRAVGDENDAKNETGFINTSGLVLLMHLNNESGENNSLVKDFSVDVNNERADAHNNGTVFGAEFDSSYKFGDGAYNFSSLSTYIEIADDDSLSPHVTGNITVCGWVKLNSFPSGGQDRAPIFAKGTTADWEYALYVNGDAHGKPRQVQLNIWESDGTEIAIPAGGNITINRWEFLCGVYDHPSATVYLNGENVNSTTATAGVRTNGNTVANIGRRPDAATGQFIDGVVDEVSIWNRSLSASEILNLYKRGALRLNFTVRSCDDSSCTGETFTDVDDTTPQILSLADNRYFQYNVTFTTDNASYTPELHNVTIFYSEADDNPSVINLTDTPDPVEVNSVVNISVNVTDDGSVDTVLIEIESPDTTKVNYTTTQNADIYYNDTFTPIQLGTHTYLIYANDTNNNRNDTESGTFLSQDTTVPTISFVATTEQNNSFVSRDWIYINVTADDLFEDNITFSIYNSSSDNINTTTLGAGNRSINFTSLPEGAYFYNVTIKDTSNNQNSTETRKITLDTTSPANVSNLANQSAGTTWIYWNWTNPGDADFNTSIVFIDGSNVANTSNTFYNATGLLSGTNYTITVHTKDHANNINDSDVNNTAQTLAVSDSTAPTINYTTPTPQNNTNQTAANFVVNVTHNESNPSTIVLYLDGVANQTQGYSGNFTNFSLNGMPDGTHTYYVQLNDSTGNINQTENRTITIDTNPPIVNLENPANDTYQTNSSMLFSYNTTDITRIVTQCELVLNSVINQTNTTITEDQTQNFSVTNIGEGLYNWNVNCTDDLGNEASSETRIFTLDTVVPEVTIEVIEPNPAETGYDNVSVNWTAIDTNINVSYANVTYPNGTFLGQYFGNFTLNVSQLNVNGDYNITLWANDSAGHTNEYSEPLTVEDALGPIITLLAPIHNSGDVDGEVLFAYNATDATNITNCSLVLDGQINVSDTSVISGELQTFFVSDLTAKRYDWNITCWDGNGNEDNSSTQFFDIVLMTSFGGLSTNLSAVTDMSNITNFTIDQPTVGRIVYSNETINLSGGVDLDALVTIVQNSIFVDTATEPRLNKSATLYLENVAYEFTPIVLRDGINCPAGTCVIGNYSNNTFEFNVTGFSSYTSAANTQLHIWDDTDPEQGTQLRFTGDQTGFCANYTDRVTNESINGTGISCAISYFVNSSWTAPENMTFNTTAIMYQHNRSFDESGLFDWNVSCIGSPQGYENLSTDDFVAIRAPDYFIQDGIATIPTGQTGVTITAGTEYEVPGGLNKSFIRIVSTRLSAVGHDSGGGTQDPDEFMVSIENPENLLTSITFRRYTGTATYNTRIYWEIIEYTGPEGGVNELVVHDQDEITQTTGTTMNGSSTTGIVNDSEVVVFITGQRHNGGGTSSTADRGLYISEWLSASDIPRFTRGDGTGTSAVSYAVVEFTGNRWSVQRVEHNYTGIGVENETIGTVSHVNRTFIHPQLTTTSGNLDEQGQLIWLAADDTLSFELVEGGVFSRRGVAWVIDNSLTVGKLPRTQRISGLRAGGGGEPDQWTEAIQTSLLRLDFSSIMGETATSSGTASAVPRGSIGFEFVDKETVNLWRSDTGQPNNYRFEIYEWPTGFTNFPPTAPDRIRCDGSTNCDILVDTGVIIDANGSVDIDGDDISYYIETSLYNASLGSDQEPGEAQILAQSATVDTIYNDNFSVDSGLWAYTGSCARVTGNGNCQSGSECLRCLGAGGSGEDGTGIATSDLTGYDECTLNYSRRANSLENNECGAHNYFDTTEHSVLVICNPADDNLWTPQTASYVGLGYTLEADSEVKFSINASGGGDFWYIDDTNLTCTLAGDVENNVTGTTYSDVEPNDYDTVQNITIFINVTAYNNSGSTSAGNNAADLEIQLFDGAGWTSIGTLGVTGNGSYNISTTNTSLYMAWKTAANHDMRVRGVFIDYVSAAARDEINWTLAQARVEGKQWVFAGNHSQDENIFWNTSTIDEQTCINIRSRTYDINGSQEFSGYYTKNSCLNITHPTAVVDISLNATVLNQTHSVRLSTNITDSDGMSLANATLKYPNGTLINLTLSAGPGNSFSLNFSNTNATGVYNFTTIYTIDLKGTPTTFNYTTVIFTVTTSAPDTFDLLTPVSGTESSNLLPNLTWEQSSDEHFDNYTILIDKNPAFTSPDFTYSTSPVTNTSKLVDSALDANDIYFWRVLAYDVYATNRNSTSDFTYITDTIPPNLTLDAPPNGGYSITTTTIFNYTPSDTNTVANCTLYHNGTGSFTANITNTTITKDTLNIFNLDLLESAYIWSVSCVDLAGNENASFAATNWTVTVDLTPPVVALVTPPNNTFENVTNNILVVVNASDQMADISSCDLIVNDEVEQTKSSITDGVEFNYTEFFVNGEYNWSVNCTDINGFVGESDTYNLSVLVVDEDPPLITLNFPFIDQHLQAPDVIFNYTPEDATGVDNCSLFIDEIRNQTNITINNFVPNYFTVDNINEGAHNWSVECTDNSTDFNIGQSAIRDFVIDLTNPVVALNTPVNNSFSSALTLFNYTPTDVNLNTCVLYGNFSSVWTTWQTNTTPISSQPNNFTQGLGDGNFIWNVWCNDTSGRAAFALNNFTVKVDTTLPLFHNISVNPASPATYIPGNLYYFNITWTDNFAIDTVFIEHNFTGALVNATVAPAVNDVYNFTITDLGVGTYVYRWYANDTDNNQNQTGQFMYVVQKTAPIINLTFNGTTGNASYIENSLVNISASLIEPPVGSLELYLDGTLINNDTVPVENLTLFVNPGMYNVTSIYRTTENYTAGEQTWFITINDTITPNVTLISPDNDTTIGFSSITFQYNVTDFSTIVNCSLYIDGSLNQTDDTITKNTTQTFSAEFVDLNYTWQVQCYDSSSNLGLSEQRVFEVIDSSTILIDVETNKTSYEVGEHASVTTNTTDRFSIPLNTSVISDIIFANTTLGWWNASWEYRKPIQISQPLNATRSITIEANLTGLNVSNCIEVRIIENGTAIHTETPRTVLQGDNSTWCFVRFNSNLGALATNETNYFVYYGNPTAIDPGQNVLRLGPYVQRGSVSSSGTVITDPIGSVNASRSFMLFTYIAGDTSPDGGMFTGSFNSSHVSFERYVSSTSTIVWQVIEHPDINAQQGAEGFTTTQDARNITINSVDLNNSFIIVTGRTDDSGQGEHHDGWFTGRFVNETTVELERGATGTNANVTWQVVEWSSVGVQRGSAQITGVTVFTDNVDITEVNTTRSIILFNRRTDSGASGINDQFARARFFNASQIVFERNDDDGTMDIEWFVIELISGTNVQYNNTFIDGSVDNDVDVGIGSVILNRSFSIISWENTGNGVTFTNAYLAGNLTTTTTLRLFKENVNDPTVDSFVAEIPDVVLNATLAKEQQFIERNISTTGVDGLSTWTFNTKNHTLGNYSAVSVASKSNFTTTSNYSWFEITLDVTNPVVVLLTPVNFTWYNNSNVTFTYVPADNNLRNCTLWHNATGPFQANISNTTPASGVNNTFNEILPDGHLLWNVQCYDDYENSGFANPNHTVFIDATPPTITLNTPGNDTNQSSPVIFNWTSNDVQASFLNCTLFIDGTQNETNINISAGNDTTRNLSLSVEGTVNWSVSCIDEAGNLGSSETSFFFHLLPPENLSVTLSGVNLTLNWTDVLGADSYSVYISTNYSERPSTPNATGLTDTNYTDVQASASTQRYYWVEAARSSATALRFQAGGKYEKSIPVNLSFVSFPLVPETLILKNETVDGFSFSTDDNCLTTLWYWNGSAYLRTDWNGSVFTPAGGSEAFTTLNMSSSYWLETNLSCNLTFLGNVPIENTTISLQQGQNAAGWNTIMNETLPTGFATPLIVVNPNSSIQAIDRYNSLTNKFEVTIHFVIGGSPWGWFPSANNPDFLTLEPTVGYVFDSLTAANWTFDPRT